MSTTYTLRWACAALAVGAGLLLGGCGGGFGEGGGETRRFDQYPNLLAIGGNGVIEAGQQQGLSVVADRDDWRQNEEVSLVETFGVDVTGSLVADPRRPLLQQNERLAAPGPFLEADFVLLAPAGASAVTRHTLRAANPRGAVTRDVFVVPTGHLYVSWLSVAEAGEIERRFDRAAAHRVLTSGRSLQLTIGLSRPAPAGGVTVALRASHSALALPATVFVPGDHFSASVTITGGAIATEAFVIVTAELGGAEQTIGLWMRSSTPFLRELALSPILIGDVRDNIGRVYLSAPAAGRTVVALASNNSLVSVPATVEIADGKISESFNLQIPPDPLITVTAVRITASYNGVVKVADAKLGRPFEDPDLTELQVNTVNNDLAGVNAGWCIQLGRDRQVEVYLALKHAVPNDTRVRLYSSRMRALRLDGEMTIPAGARSATAFVAIEVGPDAADHARYIEIRARVLSTGQERADRVMVRMSSVESLLDALVLYGGPTYFGGTTLAAQVQLVEAHSYDDVPVQFKLLNGQRELLTESTSYAFAGTQTARGELALPSVTVDTPVVLRAQLPVCNQVGPEGNFLEQGFTLFAGGGGLRDIASNRAGIFNGESARVTVRLDGAAPAGGALVPLRWSNPPPGVPDEVLIPAGQSEAGFDLSLPLAPSGVTSTRLTASYRGAVRSTEVYLLPEPAVLSIALTPDVVEGGRSVMLRVDVAPAYPVPLDVMLSSDRGAAPVSPALSIPASIGSAETSITTAVVTSAEIATVTARLRGLTVSRTLTVTPAVGSGRAWQQLGGALNVFPAPSSVEGAPAIEFDASAMPVVAFTECAGEACILAVKRWTGSAWLRLGADLDVGAGRVAGPPSLAIDLAGGAVYVAWHELDTNGASLQVYVKRWDGLAWTLVGPGELNHRAGFPASYPALRVRNGRPLVAWIESDRIIVKEWTGVIWATLGTELGPDGDAFDIAQFAPRLVLGGLPTANRPIVAWVRGSSGAGVAQQPGPAWQSLGTPYANAETGDLALGLDSVDRPLMVAAHTFDGTFDVYRLDGGLWTIMGTPLGVAGLNHGVFGIALSRTPASGSTRIAWSARIPGANAFYVSSWDGSAWQGLGSRIPAAGRYGQGGFNAAVALADGVQPALAHVTTSANAANDVDKALYVSQFR